MPASSQPAPDQPRAARRHGRALATLLAGAVAVTAAVTLDDLRAADAHAASAEARTAALGHVGELTELRTSLDRHARDADRAAATLLRAHLASLIHGELDDEQLDAVRAELLEAADRLEDAAMQDPPRRPQTLPVSLADPLLDRVRSAQSQADEVAATARAAAADAEAFTGGLAQLFDTARDLADDSELTGSTAPDAVVSTWRAEQDRLDVHRASIDELDDEVPATLRPLVEVQRTLIERLDELATELIERLEDEDLDGYNQLLDEELDLEQLGLGGELRTARDEVGASLADGSSLAEVRSRALGLRAQLGELRDAASQLLTS